MDVVAAPAGSTETDRLNAVGRLLAELVIPEPVAVYRPATDESLAFTPDVEQLLREGRIGEAMAQVGVTTLAAVTAAPPASPRGPPSARRSTSRTPRG